MKQKQKQKPIEMEKRECGMGGMGKIADDVRKLVDDIKGLRRNRADLKTELIHCTQKRKEVVKDFLGDVKSGMEAFRSAWQGL
ncbi:MAG: hypothetical protein Q7J76_00190 [Candidatus Brocadiaceae bacterium]|nr:hypothetical protein [Candidatus Brocadiaceae bacterium]